MIVIISTCKEKLSELEFVEPLKKIVGNCIVVSYKKIDEKEILKADKIIISGTCLKDFDYLNCDFGWLKTYAKPVLGICAGMQIIAKEFGARLIDCASFGIKKVETICDNKICKGNFSAYFLHTKNAAEGFEILATANNRPVVIKHGEKEIYGCIFHPEVLNTEIIKNFVLL